MKKWLYFPGPSIPTGPQPPQSNLIGWFDAADAGSITLQGSEVSSWVNKAAGGRPPLQPAQPTARPQIVLNSLNGNSGVSFAPTQTMHTDSLNSLSEIDFVLYALYTPTSTTSNQIPIYNGGSANSGWGIMDRLFGSATHGLLLGGVSFESTSLPHVINSPVLIRLSRSNSSFNSGTGFTGGDYTLSANGISSNIGNKASRPIAENFSLAVTNFTGIFYEVLVYEGITSSQAAEDYLSNKWGILHPDTISYRNRVTAAGSTINSTQLTAIDTFVKATYSAGLRSRFLEFYPLAGDTLPGALQKLWFDNSSSSPPNISSTTYTSANYSAAGGLQGNGTVFGTTGFNPSINPNTGGVFVHLGNNSTGAAIGASLSSRTTSIQTTTGGLNLNISGTQSIPHRSGLNRGVFITNRGVTSGAVYVDGGLIGTIPTSGSLFPNTELNLHSLGNGTTNPITRSSHTILCAGVVTNLTDAEASTISDLILNLVSQLGRPVYLPPYRTLQSTVFSSNSGTYANLTDGSGTTGAATASSSPAWILSIFRQSSLISSVRVGGGSLAGLPEVSLDLNDALLQYSTDGINWTTATTITGVTDSGVDQFKTFTFTAVNARYWRLLGANSAISTTEFVLS